MRLLRLLLTAAMTMAALVAVPPAPAHAAGSFVKKTDQTLDYWVYTPSSYTGATAVPVVVYLHGCQQTAEDVAVGTRWNDKAESTGFIAVYPNQVNGLIGPFTTGNGNRCWNFHDPTNADRGTGEALWIAQITQQVISDYNVDPSRVFLAGASGGGAMATVMGATYPDLYAAIGVLAGCPYFACTDVTGALAWGTMQRHGVVRELPTMVVDGTLDAVTVYPNSENVVQEWLGVADLADDTLLNGSVSRQPAAIENHGFDGQPEPGSGDPCVSFTGPPNRFPCAGGVIGFQGTYPYTVRHYAGTAHHEVLQMWTIHGAGHGYPGGDPRGSFVDPLGPDITSALWNFFQDHPKP